LDDPKGEPENKGKQVGGGTVTYGVDGTKATAHFPTGKEMLEKLKKNGKEKKNSGARGLDRKRKRKACGPARPTSLHEKKIAN